MLCQLSYAPGLRRKDCTGGSAGIRERMSDYTQDPKTDEEAPSDDALEEAQEGKGYGEDEGEREESLPE